MKIGIVTLFKALNYGAFLQAYALQQYLTDLGHDTKFLNPKTSVIDKIKSEGLIRKHYKAVIFDVKKYSAFQNALTKLRVADNQSDVTREYDAVILGSDEIWNLRNSSFRHLPLYFGVGINTNNLITYAPSCDNTTLEQIRNDPNAQKGLSIIKHFSARDENLTGIIEALTGKKPALVLDPTLLLDNYNQVEEYVDLKGYVLIYTYGFNDNEVKSIIEFARAKNLKIVSAGFYYTWCDLNLPVSPFSFLNLIKRADYVITSSFHGVIFSIINKKQFGVFANRRYKVEAILRQLDLNDRILDENNLIEDTIYKEIDFPKVNMIIDEKRRQSKEYLTSALGTNAR
jgi:hypothetical protein